MGLPLPSSHQDLRALVPLHVPLHRFTGWRNCLGASEGRRAIPCCCSIAICCAFSSSRRRLRCSLLVDSLRGILGERDASWRGGPFLGTLGAIHGQTLVCPRCRTSYHTEAVSFQVGKACPTSNKTFVPQASYPGTKYIGNHRTPPHANVGHWVAFLFSKIVIKY